MSNMSYCRFQNTLPDLRDCYEAIEEWENLSYDEMRACLWLLKLCAEINENYGYQIEDIEARIKSAREERASS